MIYKIQEGKIIVDKSEFDHIHILECGQIFSYILNDNGAEVFSSDKKATIIDIGEYYEIQTSDIPYFINFFDLNTSYSDIKMKLNNYPVLNEPIKYGNGIRILKQDIFETIISFIVSANNNIKRIKVILFKIRQNYGKKTDDFFAFPTLKELSKATELELMQIGAGYRAPYIVKVCQQLEGVNLFELDKLSTKYLREYLLTLYGIGPKVADCILLFAFYRNDVFPVDTWIEKVFNDYFYKLSDRKKIRDELVKIFGNLSGYAQQYLFYFKRENN